MTNAESEKMETIHPVVINAAAIKELIHAEGIDLVGIADAQNLILAYPPRPATDLMPTAKSVIVMAVAHSLGSVYAPDIMLWNRSKMQTSRFFMLGHQGNSVYENGVYCAYRALKNLIPIVFLKYNKIV